MPTYRCKYCHTTYERRNAFQRHEIKCRIVTMSKPEKIDFINRIDELPCELDRWGLICELYLNQKKIEKKLEIAENEIKFLRNKLGFKEDKKKDIMVWLSENSNNKVSYIDWYKNIKLDETYLEYMFKSNFVDGIINIISNKFNINDDIPIKCFANKINTIYGYVDNKWKILIPDELTGLINGLHKKIIILWRDWCNARPGIKEKDIYLKHFKNIMPKVEKDNSLSNLNRIKEHMFKQLKYDLN